MYLQIIVIFSSFHSSLFQVDASTSEQVKLENVAINDVLPLKAARRNAIANLKCFWASYTRDLISMVTFTFTMRRHLIRLASANLFPHVWQRLVGFGFRVQCRIYGGG